MFCRYQADWRILALAVATLILFAAPPAVAAGPLPEEFLGKFRGSLTGSVGEIEGDFTLVSKAEGDGFTMAWPPNNAARFKVSDRKYVFHARPQGELFNGVPAFWARLKDDQLLVYSMRIDPHGGYDIYTFILTPVEDGLEMAVRHLRSGAVPLESSARLERYGR